MTTLKFADSHNMVAFLTKSAESKGFEQIVDFLNANPINYALTINPTIYTSCIEQFWATVMVKTVNEEVQLQALVDGKRVIITEATVRRDLQLEDAEGTECLPNATIFEQLTLMSAKTTAWNEFSSTTASAIICLATNQKFNFSKYIFESRVKNLDNVNKFLMYPRKSKRKDTEVPQPSGPTTNVIDEAINKEMDDSLVRAATTASSLEAEHDNGNIDKTRSKATPNEVGSQGTTSDGGPRCQETIRDTISQTRVVSSEDEGLGKEDASKQERITNIDADAGITLASTHFDVDTDMFRVHDLDGDEVIAKNVDVVKTAKETVTTAAIIVSATIITEVDTTLA
ncbi:hypothetical protein Tco_0162491 [Tanacetum coccineum]